MCSVQEYRFRPASSDLLPILITNSPTFFPRWFHFHNNSLLNIMLFSTQLFRGISKWLSTGCQAWQVHKLLLYSIRDSNEVLFYFCKSFSESNSCTRLRAKVLGCTNAHWPDIHGHYREAKFTQVAIIMVTMVMMLMMRMMLVVVRRIFTNIHSHDMDGK